MCGRFSLSTPPDAVRAEFLFSGRPNFPPRYNIAPTQPVAIVRGERHFAWVRWGLIPPWVKDPRAFTLLINARSETVTEKASFRNAVRRRRCLLPANGFYEWRRTGQKNKQAFWVPPAHGGLIAFAGVWETWMGPDGEEMETAAILTTAANATLSPIHHRMPVVITHDDHDRWLDCSSDSAAPIAGLLKPAPDDFFAPVPVGDRVNKVANDDAGLQAFQAHGDPKDAPKTPKTAPPPADQLDLF